MFSLLTALAKRWRDASYAPGFSFEGVCTLEVYHLSTQDHLWVFLEQFCALCPQARVEVVSWQAARTERELPGQLDASVCRRVRVCERAGGAADLAVLMHSLRVSPERGSARACRGGFTRSRARAKLIIHGDGTLWRGEWAPRAVRCVLRPVLRQLERLHEAEVRRLLERRLLADPGYTLQDPPEPHTAAFRKWRLLMRWPVRLEQCTATGLVRKPRLIETQMGQDGYEHGYHFLSFPDKRKDWQGLLRTYQERRWRNMRKVGVPCAPAGQEPHPRALDLGCGTGGLADKLRREGYDTLGLDHSATAVAKAQTEFPATAFRVGSFHELARWSERYDLVVLSHVLEHAQDDLALLRDIRNVLSDSGRLYVEVPWMDRSTSASLTRWYWQTDHCREYTKLGLYLRLVQAGYEVLAHEDSFGDEGNEPYQFLLARPARGR